MKQERALLNLLGIARKAGCLSAGTEAVRSSLKKNECLLLIMSTDISDRVRKDYEEISRRKNVDCLEIAGRVELGRAVGKQQVTILSVNEARLAARIKELHRA